ncbi:xanthine dehydrogenase accessory protein XdhC [Rhizobium straminoryzae]|uniref:Xanthine dehydrogenase accessory protein XdhC n=1 Tax=Rhizobium straminoryzae TaxID=1387186 RepID=A0A549TDE4_9HYPH|nr:xanthine dehydrogenase accessory protein XdhC [Rhizobium straminoryzae]TRL40052.1 xanthine dehydrogenase accessory protein XdhC [Rhizobium straminoryzae]
MNALSAFLAHNADCVLVTVTEAKGSTPREEGAFMLVSATACFGTIGGGQLEFMAIENARALLGGKGKTEMDVPLGPDIGQCCGGRTRLAFQTVTPDVAAALIARMTAESESFAHVVLFGAGHVGQALALALAPLPLRVSVVETRPEALAGLPEGIAARAVALPEAVVDTLPAGSAVVILTHDHALDFLIARAALARGDLAYVGMIGSATKRATFRHWLARETDGTVSIDRLVLPIGGTAVRDKRPAVIAALVAAELITVLAGSGALTTTHGGKS